MFRMNAFFKFVVLFSGAFIALLCSLEFHGYELCGDVHTNEI